MSNQKKRSNLQENLFNLYLRLNGYFITGFIVHSPEWGNNRAEIDALAVRHPHHSEPERLIEPSPYLQTSSEFTDLLICEVKSKGEQLQFNESLRNSIQAINSVLHWSGLFLDHETQELSYCISQMMQPSEEPKQTISCITGPRQTQIRVMLCSPERWTKRNNQTWFIPGSEIFSYLYACFCPDTRRSSCSTQYDFSLWGEIYEPIVRFFKEHYDKQKPGKMKELYAYLKV